jgi:hypothetical protein
MGLDMYLSARKYMGRKFDYSDRFENVISGEF